MGRAFEYRRAAKEKRWDKMSKLFPKLGKAITMAAKEGGEDPATNAKLRTAIQNAKSENMPKDNIEAAIKRAAQKDISSFTEVNYEGKGPHGVLVFVECATDNTTRTVANIKSYFNKAGGGIVPNGSLEFMFNRRAVFEFEIPEGMDVQELELELIDLQLQKAKIESDLYYYSLLEKDLPLSKSDRLTVSQDKKNLSMLRQVIDFFSGKVNNILKDNIQLDEKTTPKTTKSRTTSRRS